MHEYDRGKLAGVIVNYFLDITNHDGGDGENVTSIDNDFVQTLVQPKLKYIKLDLSSAVDAR